MSPTSRSIFLPWLVASTYEQKCISVARQYFVYIYYPKACITLNILSVEIFLLSVSVTMGCQH